MSLTFCLANLIYLHQHGIKKHELVRNQSLQILISSDRHQDVQRENPACPSPTFLLMDLLIHLFLGGRMNHCSGRETVNWEVYDPPLYVRDVINAKAHPHPSECTPSHCL